MVTHTGRNDPCPCGSGRKYKKCCGLPGDTGTVAEVSRANAVKELDRQLSDRLMRFAQMRLGRDWLEPALDAYVGDEIRKIDETELMLLIPWAMYHWPVREDDVTVASLFEQEKGSQLSRRMRDVLLGQFESWLSVWEVREIENGLGLSVTDLLTGEERFVHELSALEFLHARDAVLAEVVDGGGISFFGSIHPQPLKPRDAEHVVRQIRKMCRVRTRPVKVTQLRDLAVQLTLIDAWRSLVAELREHPRRPTLINTDGDALVLTTDHFDIATKNMSAVVTKLASFPGAQLPKEVAETTRDTETEIIITKPGNAKMKSWDNTVIGRVVIAGKRMRVESNSAARADALRDSLTSHLGNIVRYRLRSETSPEEMFRLAEEGGHGDDDQPRPAQDPEFAAMARKFKEQHMLAWLDDEIPALGGLTPREAAQSPRFEGITRSPVAGIRES